MRPFLTRTPKLVLFPFLSILFLLPLSGASQKEEKGKGSSEENAPRPSSDLDVSKEEMKKLVRIDKKLQGIQVRAQKELKKNIENSELGRQRYGEIRRAQRSGDNPDMTEKEKEQLEKLEKKNKKTREQMKSKMKKKVKAEGMSFDRYQRLRKAISRDPDLRGRYRKHMKARESKR